MLQDEETTRRSRRSTEAKRHEPNRGSIEPAAVSRRDGGSAVAEPEISALVLQHDVFFFQGVCLDERTRVWSRCLQVDVVKVRTTPPLEYA